MTDIDIARACAKKLGLTGYPPNNRFTADEIRRHHVYRGELPLPFEFDPVNDARIAMELLQAFPVECAKAILQSVQTAAGPTEYVDRCYSIKHTIAECVASLP